MQQKPNKSIFNRLVRRQEFKIISIRLEIRNQHIEMHQIPSMEEESATSSAKPVSLTHSQVRGTHYDTDFVYIRVDYGLYLRLNDELMSYITNRKSFGVRTSTPLSIKFASHLGCAAAARSGD